MPSLPNLLHQSFAEAWRKGNPMAKMETLKLTVDAEQFREDLKTMVGELVEQAAASLDLRIRMIVRNELDPQKASAPR